MIDYWGVTVKSSAGFEGKVERNDRGDRNGAARDNADESFIAHTPADEPVDGCAGQWREDDYAEEVVFHSTAFRY
jgi:hypothetical protein